MLAEDTSPRRRTRPKGRKQQILDSAATLFVQNGFPNVTMNAIAASVDITAGALYRHYPNKAELLALAIRQSLDSFPRIDSTSSLDEALSLACDAAVRHRQLGALWSRQLQYLPDDDQAELREHLRDINRTYLALIERYRPELSREQARLLSRAVESVLSSPGTHSLVLPSAEYAGLLKTACRSLCDTHLSENAGPASPSVPALEPVSRRELLLQKAIQLFAAKGVHATSMEDIGATVGVTGPSLYTHFRGKEDILAAALDRATQALWLDLGEALHQHSDARQALQAVVRGYVRRTHGRLQLTSLALIDSRDDPTVRTRQREYVREWVALIRSSRSDLEQAPARALAHAGLAVIHDVSRTPAAFDTSIEDNLTAMVMAILGCAD
ncbi:TetR/AcrR family transcriptional regulator [Dietzia sp. KRD202]|uniref:TetR/AcrR family transcriptional regulator n=1 Tax=Dietzia sp. KRD202 TaxID=2729732 RepID=UPI0019D1055A|nr:TetR/AcrR family transcriptional regulator [Dietzia sp. KRD202]